MSPRRRTTSTTPPLATLLVVPNRSRARSPVVVHDDDYVGYFDSDERRQLVFVQRPGQSGATVYIGTRGRWEQHEMRWGGPAVFTRPEGLWAYACMKASASLRPSGE